jgi:hypothetical protein
MLSVARDAVSGPDMLVRMAGVYARLGDAGPALNILEQAARLPHGIDYGQLKLDAVWDSLRQEPRFAAIVESLAPRDEK